MSHCTIIILGATGDLARRKLIPAVYKLLDERVVSECTLVGVSLEQGTKQTMLSSARASISDLNYAVWQRLESSSYYISGDFYDPATYKELHELLGALEKNGASSNRLFYLATMPEHFEHLTQQLAAQNIVKHASKTDSWQRVVYEKPFGQDGVSAKRINNAISEYFDESQIYRIDHWLGKEIVANISLLRFSNMVFRSIWHHEYIDHVQIILNESDTVRDRGAYYDSYGAIKDMIQNHALQLLALVAMEDPERLTGEAIRDAKTTVLQALQVHDCMRGQYRGYTAEKNITDQSETETFAALACTIDVPRWKSVPFYIKTGKALPEKSASIHIYFKLPHTFASEVNADQNCLTIQIDPDEGFILDINAKVPGEKLFVTPVHMNFSHHTLVGPNSTTAYERLLRDVIMGDQSVFVRFDEILASWKAVEGAVKISDEIYKYEQGSRGPKELKLFEQRHGMSWKK